MRLPFDDNATVNTIIADRQVLHTDVEVVALAREFEQSGVPFRRIDSKLVTYDPIALGDRRRANSFHDTDDVDDIGIGHVWRGKPKVRSPVKQSTRVAHCLGACHEPVQHLHVIDGFLDDFLVGRRAVERRSRCALSLRKAKSSS